jgi:hypothetical protein
MLPITLICSGSKLSNGSTSKLFQRTDANERAIAVAGTKTAMIGAVISGVFITVSEWVWNKLTGH